MMTRTRYRNKFLRNRSAESRDHLNKQRNCYVHIMTKSNIEYYGNLNQENATANKTFRKTVKPFLSSKTTNQSQIIPSRQFTEK